MNKFFQIIFTGILVILLCTNMLTAQVFYTEPDSGKNFGITYAGGLMGFAWGDYDGDGYLDIIIAGGSKNSALYRNAFGETTASDTTRFIDVTKTSQSDATPGKVYFDPGVGGTDAVLWGDFDGDGKIEPIVGTMRQFKNYGDSIAFIKNYFTTSTANGGWGNAAADYDRDGDLDMACAAGPGSNCAGPPHIFRNEGGTFVEATDDLITVNLTIESWCPEFVDVNNDGWMDLWFSNIRNTSTYCPLFMNNQGVEFILTDPATTGLMTKSAINSTWGDFNNDGYMDLFLTPFAGDADGKAKLYQNNGNETFTDIATAMGLDSVYTFSRSSDWGDYDNDGDLDLLVNQGAGPNPGRSHLWRNDNNGSAFVEVSAEAGLNLTTSDRRTMSFVDYDNDGWLDIFLKHNGSPAPRLFHNEGGNSNHWIVFKAQDTTSNTAGIGARFRIVTGSLSQIRDIKAGDAGGGSGQIRAHFGLGSATTVDSVIVRWPNGITTVATNLAADKYYTATPTSIISGVQKQSPVPTEYALSQNYPNPFNPTTTIEFFLPVRSDVRLVLVDLLGRVVKEMAVGNYTAGKHEVKLDASNLASGIYFYKLVASDFVNVKKLVLMK